MWFDAVLKKRDLGKSSLKVKKQAIEAEIWNFSPMSRNDATVRD